MRAGTERINGPHQGQEVLVSGASARDAQAGAVMVHGRGASAADILTLVPELDQPGFRCFAPQARGHSWYPYSFLAPTEQNEPGLSSGLQAIADVLARLATEGIPAERVMLLGFSQGACLTLEYVARNPRRYGCVAALSGALITLDHTGSLASTPVFLGCSPTDPHIPRERVEESTAVLRGIGAEATMRLYPGMGHTINRDEIAFVQEMMSRLTTGNARV